MSGQGDKPNGFKASFGQTDGVLKVSHSGGDFFVDKSHVCPNRALCIEWQNFPSTQRLVIAHDAITEKSEWKLYQSTIDGSRKIKLVVRSHHVVSRDGFDGKTSHTDHGIDGIELIFTFAEPFWKERFVALYNRFVESSRGVNQQMKMPEYSVGQFSLYAPPVEHLNYHRTELPEVFLGKLAAHFPDNHKTFVGISLSEVVVKAIRDAVPAHLFDSKQHIHAGGLSSNSAGQPFSKTIFREFTMGFPLRLVDILVRHSSVVFLDSAEPGEKSTEDIISKTVSSVEENTTECFHTSPLGNEMQSVDEANFASELLFSTDQRMKLDQMISTKGMSIIREIISLLKKQRSGSKESVHGDFSTLMNQLNRIISVQSESKKIVLQEFLRDLRRVYDSPGSV